MLGADIRSGVHTEELSAWSTAPPVHFSSLMPLAALLIAVFAVTSIILWFGFGFRLIALAAFICELIFLYLNRARVAQVIAAVERPSRELILLSEILARLEQEQFSSSRLVNLRKALDTDGLPPSMQIARLSKLIQILDSMKNMFFGVIAMVLLIPAQLAYALERWRHKSGSKIPQWLEAVGEIEALSALACYAYEHPADPFPDLIEDRVCFDGEALGHPLIS